jgi:parvulin-like peptidyl-prolyl isomerase
MFLSLCFGIVALAAQIDVPGKYLVPAPDANKVIAKVDGVEIRASDVQSLLWQWRGQEATADLISYQVIKNAAAKEQITVPDTEVQKALDAQIALLTPDVLQGKTADEYLLGNGFTRSRLWIRIKTELLLNKIAAKDFKPGEYLKISTIMIKPESTSTTALTNAAKKADALYDMIKKGDGWEKVLSLSTSDLQTLNSKGLVGWRRIDALPQMVQTEVATLKAGDVTKPVQTQNGFQIFRIEMFGKDAKGDDLLSAEAIHAISNKQAVARKIQAAAKIEKFPQN